MLHGLELRTFHILRAACSPVGGARASAPPSLPIVICVSGGRDSMALLQAFVNVARSPLARKLPGLDLRALHFNHEKRGSESEHDARFVGEQCVRLNVPLRTERYSETGPGPGGNFQQRAREWRHGRARAFLKEITECIIGSQEDYLTENFGWVAMAHHARDHAESLLLHLTRGSGPQGLLGLVPVDACQRILRPFAEIPYDEIVDYQESLGIPFREDQSNASADYSRNHIRHRVLPELAQLNPAIESALVRLSRSLRDLMPASLEKGNLPLDPFPSTARLRDHIVREVPELAHALTTNSLQNLIRHAHLHCLQPARSLVVPLSRAWEACLQHGHLLVRRSPAQP